MNIRLAIADDHPMIIDGVKNMLSVYPHITLTGTYQNGRELMEGLKKSTPDVLLLDIQLPDHTGDDLAPDILKHYPEIHILTLTNIDSTISLYNMLRHGVQGYLLKTASQETLIKAIEAVYNGEEYIDPSMQERLQQFKLTMRREASLKVTLTPREKQILQLIVNGETGKEISNKLNIGFRTIEHYRLNILLKLEVNNTAALVKKALKLGLAE
jgi:DNA-binding NarL/FixJ family response regulator